MAVDLTEAVALTLCASALIARCQEMLAKLATPATIEDEISRFRDEATRHIDAAGTSLPVLEEAEARRIASDHIEAICAELRGGAPPPMPAR